MEEQLGSNRKIVQQGRMLPQESTTSSWCRPLTHSQFSPHLAMFGGDRESEESHSIGTSQWQLPPNL